MNENSTGKRLDRTNLKRLDSLTDEEIEQAASVRCRYLAVGRVRYGVPRSRDA